MIVHTWPISFSTLAHGITTLSNSTLPASYTYNIGPAAFLATTHTRNQIPIFTGTIASLPTP